jgi:hypothetical protein
MRPAYHYPRTARATTSVSKRASASWNEPIAGIQVLMCDENLMDIERMRRFAGQMIAHDLKNMAQSRRIVDVDVRTTFSAVLEERHLQVPERI